MPRGGPNGGEHRGKKMPGSDNHEDFSISHCECGLTIVLNGRTTTHFHSGPRTNCKRAHGAATMIHGPFQLFVRPHEFPHLVWPSELATRLGSDGEGFSFGPRSECQ